MQFAAIVNGINVKIDLPGVTKTAFQTISLALDEALKQPKVKNRDSIKDAYLTALKTCPTANASDLWHHIVYRQYCEILKKHKPQDPKQSWVRASGDALELAVMEIYSARLLEENIRIEKLISKPKKRAALEAMGIAGVVGSDKLDVGLFIDDTDQIFGGVHVKASLAERISDDVPCSRAMMEKGYFSPLWTLDVKSFPPPQGDLVNRGELGTPDSPTEKRKYIEEHGDFDDLFSANTRTVPSKEKTNSGKRIITLDLAKQPDLFAQEVIKRAKAFLRKGKAAKTPKKD